LLGLSGTLLLFLLSLCRPRLLLSLLLLRLRTWGWSTPHRTRIPTHLRLLPLLLRPRLRRYRALLLPRRGNTFTLCLLSSWSRGAFSLRRTWTSLDPLLRCLLSSLFLLDTSLLASRVSLLTPIYGRLLLLSRLLNSSRRLRCLLCSSSTLTLTFVTNLELLTLRAVRNCLDAHRLRDVTPEPRFDRRSARNHWRVVELPGDSRRNVDLSTTPR
jgi:hypothetical protein